MVSSSVEKACLALQGQKRNGRKTLHAIRMLALDEAGADAHEKEEAKKERKPKEHEA
jgi:hypothetical protein